MLNVHGGDTYGRKIRLDFSANLNPLGMPESVKNAALTAVGYSGRYPDPYCRKLVEKLSRYEGTELEKIVCGNGADDLIFRIVHALRPKRAVIAEPTFSEYEKALREVGCAIRRYAPDHILSGLTGSNDMLILCSPNNPTGQIIGCNTLADICMKCSQNGTVFLCDECFIDLCEKPAAHSVKQFINDNVIVLKAFTKTYAMAGLRLGYALFGSADTARKVRESGQFWSVSTVAQAAGIAALDEVGYVDAARRIIAEERDYLSGELRRYGFTVFPSKANFILFRCDMPLYELLLNKGIMIRNCADYNGLGDGFFRTAVRLHDENVKLISSIEEVIRCQRT